MIPEKVLKHVNDPNVSERYKRMYLRAWEKPGKKSIMKAKCIECCGFEDVVSRVRNCTVDVCPINQFKMSLFPVSSVKTHEIDEQKQKAMLRARQYLKGVKNDEN